MNSFQPLADSSVWQGAELFARPDWELGLTSSECEEIDDALAVVSEKPAEQFTQEDFPLPTLERKLRKIQQDLEHGCGACYLRGLDVSKYSTDDAKKIFWGLMLYIGTPVSQSAAGERIFSVRDEGFKMGDQKARGPNTSKRLSFHTDRCDVISFLTLKQAKSGGENQLVSSKFLYNEIGKRRPDLLKILQEPFYYLRHNVDTGNDKPWCRQPVFSIYEGHFACNFLRVLIERAAKSDDLPELTDEQIEALDFLETVAAEPENHVTFRQEPGDLLLVNNWVLLHRRNEFEDFEALDARRHLLRIWLSMPNSRPLHPDFAGNYGATEAGAIRGGMKPLTEET
ncbi:MAG: TauD/TfdA family dioxygenase [Planctomycetaceae bacterium]|nr:TauD/TfdA family dioxygenase [Planctomycetaceae bacterium]